MYKASRNLVVMLLRQPALFGIFQVASSERGSKPVSVRALTGLPLYRSCHCTVLCHCCSTSLSSRPAHLYHLFAYNNLSPLRASLRPVLLAEYPGTYDASRVCIRMDGAVEPFSGSIALYSVYDIFACGYLAVYSSIEAHATNIYWPEGHRCSSWC